MHAFNVTCLNHGLLEPVLVVERGEAVSDDARALVLPQWHQQLRRCAHLWRAHQHALQHTSQNVNSRAMIYTYVIHKTPRIDLNLTQKTLWLTEQNLIAVGLVGVTYLPNSGQVSQVEDVVKLGRCRQHLDLDFLPEFTGGQHQWRNRRHNVLWKAALLHNTAISMNAIVWALTWGHEWSMPSECTMRTV